MLPSQPSKPSVLMNVGKYSAHPAAPAAWGVPAELYGGWLKAAEGDAWTDSDGPAAEGKILFVSLTHTRMEPDSWQARAKIERTHIISPPCGMNWNCVDSGAII